MNPFSSEHPGTTQEKTGETKAEYKVDIRIIVLLRYGNTNRPNVMQEQVPVAVRYRITDADLTNDSCSRKIQRMRANVERGTLSAGDTHGAEPPNCSSLMYDAVFTALVTSTCRPTYVTAAAAAAAAVSVQLLLLLHVRAPAFQQTRN